MSLVALQRLTARVGVSCARLAPDDLARPSLAVQVPASAAAPPGKRTLRQLAAALLSELRRLDRRITDATATLSTAVAASGTTLTQLHGIGDVLAAKILARTGSVTRFRSSSAFASFCGVAPISVSSGDIQRHRLSGAGDRQLSYALHVMAITQTRRPSPGKDYYQRKRAVGNTNPPRSSPAHPVPVRAYSPPGKRQLNQFRLQPGRRVPRRRRRGRRPHRLSCRSGVAEGPRPLGGRGVGGLRPTPPGPCRSGAHWESRAPRGYGLG